jgi:transposase
VQRLATLDFADIHHQLKRKGVTRQLLWEEYSASHPAGYGYTQFCVLYRDWRSRLKLSMRQTHRAGEKLFVDYCGPTVPIVNVATGEVREAQVFVAVLGASNYTYAEATWTQSLPDWIGSHTRAFAFFGGTPQLIIPDNLKSGVTRACRYEPLLNTSYAEMLAHYGTAAMPARPYKPRDKAKVEVGVQIVERWILARLRHHTFFSLFDLNLMIRTLLIRLNERPFRKLPGSRRTQFEALDCPALSPLPPQTYEFAEWKRARVNVDYHVEVAGHYYSVPHSLVKREIARPPDGHLRGVLSSLQAHRRSCPQRVARRSFHATGPHAESPPRASGVDARSLPQLGRRDRPLHARSRPSPAGAKVTPGAGLSQLLRVARLEQALWERPAGSRLSARPRPLGADAPQCPVHPPAWTRPGSAPRPGTNPTAPHS